MNRSLALCILLLAALLGLGACGNKGPLVQADKADTTKHDAKKDGDKKDGGEKPHEVPR